MLSNCWEIRKYGREKGGINEKEFGPCPAYPNNGHSCFIISGTYCFGEVQGTFAKKEGTCLICEVYKLYSPFFGEKKEQFKEEYPEEYENCLNFFKNIKRSA